MQSHSFMQLHRSSLQLHQGLGRGQWGETLTVPVRTLSSQESLLSPCVLAPEIAGGVGCHQAS